MSRRLGRGRLVVASHNEGKVTEIRYFLAPLGFETLSARELGLAEPEETGATFEANAILKAEAAAAASGLPALADDSGLVVEALGGDPGIHTARWAGPERDFGRAMRLVEEALQRAGARELAQRRASFVAVLAVGWPDGHVETVRGEVAGALIWPPRGDVGFGYDPMFLPDGHDRTFGEMDAAAKHGWLPGMPKEAAVSHRARAFVALTERILGG